MKRTGILLVVALSLAVVVTIAWLIVYLFYPHLINKPVLSKPKPPALELHYDYQHWNQQAWEQLQFVDNTPLTADIPLIAAVKPRPPIGINVNELHHEDASFPFVDLFRQADPFQNNVLELPNTEKVEYNEFGWPLRLNGDVAGTKFLGKMPPDAVPVGDFTVLYDGKGTLEYGHGVERMQRQRGRERIRLHPDASGELNASLLITSMDETDPIRNIRILMPGGICQNNPYQWVAQASECSSGVPYLAFERYYQSIVFNPEYLNFLKDFSAIRFMPMSGITRNPESHWRERPQLQEATWGGTYGQRGAPLEIMVMLANRMQVDAWFNLPHAADDDYVRRYATYVRDHLSPHLRVYVEYTNEVWNTAFSHSEYTQKKGIEAGYSINSVEAGYQYYIQRASEVFAIWEEVFGGRERLTRVIGGWDTRADISRKLLGLYGGYQYADALAIAPYFGGNTKGFRESETVDDILRLTAEEDSFRSLPQVLHHVKEQVAVAHQYGVDLIAYEGGQGLVDWVTREADQHPNPLFFAANRDPRMGELYTQFLEGWRDAGGGLLMIFSSPRTCQWFGCWGIKEHIRQPLETAHKYRSILNFIAQNPYWQSQPVQVPATLPEAQPVAITPSARRERAPEEPVIVFRPARDPERYFFLENPQTLDNLLLGDTWEKRNLFGKWQAKWDKQFLYLTVRVYDANIVHDSERPEDDDSVEVYIDADNSRLPAYDGINDFRMLFAWGREQVILDPKSPQFISPDLKFDFVRNEDGYTLNALIPWRMLGVSVDVKHRLGIDIQVNDDDDGGSRDRKVSWIAREDKAINDPRLLGVVLISGR